MMSTRDPHPFPKLQNDDDFIGPQSTQKQAYTVPTHLAQKQAPWHRLNTTPTLASFRREVTYYDPSAPKDSLDFVLKSQYDHHAEFLKAPNETLVQCETLNQDHGRVLKNRVINVPPEKNPLNHPLRICKSLKKESLNSIKTAIEGNHTQTTNGGYSRKPDGGFFAS